MQSKQNHICALWWFQGFKSLTVEFSVGSSPAVQVASGNLWFSDLAGEWQEEMLLKNICQGCGAPCPVNYRRGCMDKTDFPALLQANWVFPPRGSFLLSGGGRHLCLCSETCYCCHEQHMLQRVTEGPAVQTYLTAESKEVPECGGRVVRLGTLSLRQF